MRQQGSMRLSRLYLAFVALTVILMSGCGGGGSVNSPAQPGIIVISGQSPSDIPSTAYGQNYWDWAYTGLGGTESVISDLHINVYRAGGTTNDLQENGIIWDKTQVDKYITYCRAINAEPLLSVSVIKGTAQKAADWVTYCNVQKGYNVKYWIIGNEPDLYNDSNYISGYTVQDYIRDFKAYSAAMKAVDPTIKIIGPELAWKYVPGNDWMTPFLQSCHDDVDIVSFHYYPYGNSGDFTINNVLGSDSITRGKIDAVQNIVSQYCSAGKPIALTETHVSWSSVMGEAASAETFYAGLWIADTAGICLEKKLWSVVFWGTDGGYGTGFLNTDNTPRPSYYALQMFTTHFGKYLINATQIPQGLSVYVSRNQANDRTVMIVINKTSAPKQETVSFTDFSPTLPDRQYTFPAYSLTCLMIPDDGSAMECWSYTKDLADLRQPPSHQTIP